MLLRASGQVGCPAWAARGRYSRTIILELAAFWLLEFTLPVRGAAASLHPPAGLAVSQDPFRGKAWDPKFQSQGL